MSRPHEQTDPEPERSVGPRTGGGGRDTRSSTRNALEWLAVLLVAVLLAVGIKTFVVQAFKIPSESMEPTLMPGDRVVVNKLSYRAHEVNRGDIVVFHRPERAPAGPNAPEQLIKRVIGLPGDTITTRDEQIVINGKDLVEPYLPEDTPTFDLDNPITVPSGQVWVMGDNRLHSGDSRYFGPIEIDSIIGRAFFKIWPPGRLGSL